MKLISNTCSGLVSYPHNSMAINEIGYNDILRDIYDSEELKIESERCRALKGTIETLCTKENHTFIEVFEIWKEIDMKTKKIRLPSENLFQASYMFQVERLPVLLGQLGKEHQDTRNGAITDSILCQVLEMC